MESNWIPSNTRDELIKKMNDVSWFKVRRWKNPKKMFFPPTHPNRDKGVQMVSTQKVDIFIRERCGQYVNQNQLLKYSFIQSFSTLR